MARAILNGVAWSTDAIHDNSFSLDRAHPGPENGGGPTRLLARNSPSQSDGVNDALEVAGVTAVVVRDREYRQEYYPGDAEDMAFVVRLDAEVEVDGETICESCLQVLEWNPLEPEALEYKFYQPEVGLVREQSLDSDESLDLVEAAR